MQVSNAFGEGVKGQWINWKQLYSIENWNVRQLNHFIRKSCLRASFVTIITELCTIIIEIDRATSHFDWLKSNKPIEYHGSVNSTLITLSIAINYLVFGYICDKQVGVEGLQWPIRIVRVCRICVCKWLNLQFIRSVDSNNLNCIFTIQYVYGSRSLSMHSNAYAYGIIR